MSRAGLISLCLITYLQKQAQAVEAACPISENMEKVSGSLARLEPLQEKPARVSFLSTELEWETMGSKALLYLWLLLMPAKDQPGLLPLAPDCCNRPSWVTSQLFTALWGTFFAVARHEPNRDIWGSARASLDVSCLRGRHTYSWKMYLDASVVHSAWKLSSLQTQTPHYQVARCKVKGTGNNHVTWFSKHYFSDYNWLAVSPLKISTCSNKMKCKCSYLGVWVREKVLFIFPMKMKKIIISGVKTVICHLNQLIIQIHLIKWNHSVLFHFSF